MKTSNTADRIGRTARESGVTAGESGVFARTPEKEGVLRFRKTFSYRFEPERSERSG